MKSLIWLKIGMIVNTNPNRNADKKQQIFYTIWKRMGGWFTVPWIWKFLDSTWKKS